MDVAARLEKAVLVRDLYPDFVPFLRDAMQELGFSTTWMQADIAEFMQSSGNLCVQAQRGAAKSTIACILAVHKLTQDPSNRILLVSGSGGKAVENAHLIYGLIMRWDLLDYLRPERGAGDRDAVGSFDVHWSLKGVDKSASVTCLGITSSLQGFRADLLIADDVETNRNGMTAAQRAILLTLTKEFSSIVADRNGQILYLGTPQTKDSIYNTLPMRGFQVRIWPGRFPQASDIQKYGDLLAPSIAERMQILGDRCLTGGGLDGKRGWPTDPERIPEDELQDKELDQGPETFELQFMLNTNLSDALRQQLRLRDLVILDTAHNRVPETVEWSPQAPLKLSLPKEYPVRDPDFYYAAGQSSTFVDVQNITMALDPAGRGGDELSYAIGGVVAPYLHVLSAGGLQGGVNEENLATLVEIIMQYDVKHVRIEANMGHGTVLYIVQNYFNTFVDGKPRLRGVGVSEVYSTQQKELRIIEALRPPIQRHRLVVHRNCIEQDLRDLQQYALHNRNARSLFLQMQDITTDRGSLQHDDRLDALAILVQYLGGFLLHDEEEASKRRSEAVAREFVQNPMGRVGVQAPARTGRSRPRRVNGAFNRNR